MSTGGTTFIHVGLPKTATTFLQNHVFPNVSGIRYLGRTARSGHIDVLADRICKVDPVAGRDFDFGTLRDHVLQERAQAPHDEGPAPPDVISIEDFSSVRTSLLLGRMKGERLCDRVTMAKRLRALFPNARIIVTIRAHAALLESFYLYVMKRNTCFVPPSAWFEENAKPGGMLDTFHIAPLITAYESVFGHGTVLVLPYERLQTNPEGFFTALFEFMGLEAEPCSGFVRAAGEHRTNAREEDGRIARYLFESSRMGSRFRWLPAPLLSPFVDLDAWRHEVHDAIAMQADRFLADARALALLRPELKPELEALGYFGFTRSGSDG